MTPPRGWKKWKPFFLRKFFLSILSGNCFPYLLFITSRHNTFSNTVVDILPFWKLIASSHAHWRASTKFCWFILIIIFQATLLRLSPRKKKNLVAFSINHSTHLSKLLVFIPHDFVKIKFLYREYMVHCNYYLFHRSWLFFIYFTGKVTKQKVHCSRQCLFSKSYSPWNFPEHEQFDH